MRNLEVAVYDAIKNLRRKNKVDGVRLSLSHRPSGLLITENDIFDLLASLRGSRYGAYFHGLNPAKDSWRDVFGVTRPLWNATIIELCKYLPYLGFLDKNDLYRMLGIRIGKNTTIGPRVQFDCFNPELIEIGDSCLVGDSASFWTHDYYTNSLFIGSVNIGDRVKIGACSIIGPSDIGNDVEIGVNSFVYGKVPSNSRVVPVKTRVIKHSIK